MLAALLAAAALQASPPPEAHDNYQFYLTRLRGAEELGQECRARLPYRGQQAISVCATFMETSNSLLRNAERIENYSWEVIDIRNYEARLAWFDETKDHRNLGEALRRIGNLRALTESVVADIEQRAYWR
ncbi:hypothetical protein FKB34_11410 [Glycocaulis profundi]|nr:hypothetical protein FKB34_11410 [Glycocaulis profundi]